MKNYNQCECGLVYNEFSIILIQTFTSPGIEIPDLEKPEFKSFIKRDCDGNFDDQLFTNTCPEHPWDEAAFRHKHKDTHTGPKIERYRLKGFDICIEIDGPTPARLWGHVHVRATVFFNKTVEISYRIIEMCIRDRETSCSTRFGTLYPVFAEIGRMGSPEESAEISVMRESGVVDWSILLSRINKRVSDAKRSLTRV